MVALQRGGRSRFVLALLLLTAVTLATLDARGFGPVESARGFAVTIVTPFRSAVDWVTSPVSSTWNGIWGYRDLEEENAALRAELEDLRGQEFRETTARLVLEQWATQADLTFAVDVPQVMSRVVAGPTSNFEETVTIDKGSDNGIRVGMAAVTGAGLVGRVESVTGNRSVIQLLTDRRVRVGVRLLSTGDIGLVEGEGRSEMPTLVVSGAVGLSEGERLETSGLEGSLYPPDIPIGRIVALPDEVVSSTTSTTTGTVPSPDSVTTVRVPVELSADLDALTFITILLWEPPG